MEKVIVDGQELDIKLSIKEAKMMIALMHDGKLGSAQMEIGLKLEAVVDMLEQAIPGDWDKIPASMIKEALKKL